MNKLLNELIERWEKDAAQYKLQVEEAQRKNVPYGQMLCTVITLRQCAKELRDVMSKGTI